MTFTPTAVREIELTHPVQAIKAGPGYGSAFVLARWHSEPVALVDIPLLDGAASARQVARCVWDAVESLVGARYALAGEPRPVRQAPVLARPAVRPGDPSDRYYGHPAGRGRRPAAPAADSAGFPAELLTRGLRLPWPPGYLIGRATTLRNAPPASVIVCTRNRAGKLADCVAAVLRQDYPDFEVIVVDNAPATDAAERLVAQLHAGGTGGVPLRRVAEPRPGLSRARNTGLAAASGRIVAYLDDDERPDRHWLAELARGFNLAPGVTGVSGLVLPAALDTPAQGLYEQLTGHSQGRGLTHEVFDQASHARQHPLYPLPAFGSGASVAFDRAALLRIGGFDLALGAGTPAQAGEDTAAISDLMLDGGTFVYWPGAVMWHVHRRTMPDVERQLNGYGSGLAAFYSRAVLRDPRRLATLGRLAPRALRDLSAARTASIDDGYPERLRRASRLGMLAGPARYLRARAGNWPGQRART